MRWVHRGGEKSFVDYTGKTPASRIPPPGAKGGVGVGRRENRERAAKGALGEGRRWPLLGGAASLWQVRPVGKKNEGPLGSKGGTSDRRNGGGGTFHSAPPYFHPSVENPARLLAVQPSA